MSAPIPVNVLIAGCSYAGLSAATNLIDLQEGVQPRAINEPFSDLHTWPRTQFNITIVDERGGFFHTVGAPLAMADIKYAERAWVNFEDMDELHRPDVTFVHGTIVQVDCEHKRATIKRRGQKDDLLQDYDYLVVTTGLKRAWPVVPQSMSYEEYLNEVGTHVKAMQAAQHGVLVVGGGAVGIEMAAELKLVMPDLKVTLAHSRDKLLSSEGLTDECKDTALRLLKDAGVEVLLNHRLESQGQQKPGEMHVKREVKFTNGHTMEASEVIMAVSHGKPSTGFLPTSALDDKGQVKVQANMMFPVEVPKAEYHFCAGDASRFSGIKRCGGAFYGGSFVAVNIHQHVLEQLDGHEAEYKEVQDEPPKIALAVGKNAVAADPTITMSGPEVMQKYFQDDLYLSGSLKWLGL